MNKLEDVIQRFRMEVGPVFISTDIVGTDGISIGGGSIIPNFDSTEACGRGAIAYNLCLKVVEKLQMGEFKEGLMTSDKIYMLTMKINESYYWGMAVARQAILGNIRMLVKEYMPQIIEAIPQ